MNEKEKIKKRNKEEYEFCKERKICVRCHKNLAMYGSLACPECSEKHSERNKKRYAKLKEDANAYAEFRRKDSQKRSERLHKRLDSGICYNCGKRPAATGRIMCRDCAIALNRKLKEKRGGIDRSIRIELGLCYICGEPVLEGRKVCAAHYHSNACWKMRRERGRFTPLGGTAKESTMIGEA